MIDMLSETMVLPPQDVEKRTEELQDRYHIQATEARSRHVAQFEQLVNRWEDKETGRNLLQSFSFIGAIKVTETELHELEDSPLRDFINCPSDNYSGAYKYRMNYGNEYDLRGEAYYQLFDRNQTPEERLKMTIDTTDDLLQRHDRIQNYVSSKDKLSPSELKTYLAFLDHLKVELLRVFHAETHLEASNQSEAKGTQLKKNPVQDALTRITDSYYSILDGKRVEKIEIDKESIMGECNLITKSVEQKRIGAESLEGVVRGLPEGDNPLMNKIYAIGLVNRLEKEGTKNLVLAGMHFGGVELPWTVLNEIKLRGLEEPEIVTVHYSRYTNKTDTKKDFWEIVDHLLDTNKKLLILDDGVYSGDSLQKVILAAVEAGFVDIAASVQLLANSRQIGRMLSTGGINPDFVDKMLVDAIGVSPFFRTRTSKEYKERKSMGLFNIIAERVRKMISANYPSHKLVGKDVFQNVRRNNST